MHVACNPFVARLQLRRTAPQGKDVPMFAKKPLAILAGVIAFGILADLQALYATAESDPTTDADLSGVFYNLVAQAGGTVTSTVSIQQSTATGYLNFTNFPGQSALCGAGNLSGAHSNGNITGSFVSNDLDPGCGFDHGAIFNITSTLDIGSTHFWGEYQPKNAGGSQVNEYPGVFETWAMGYAPSRVTFQGTFTNTSLNRGGPVVLDIAFGANTVSGFMNYTNPPGESALCGAGEFAGVRYPNDAIQFSFSSADPDLGCGFDNGLTFVMDAHLAPDSNSVSGTYYVSGQGGVFTVFRIDNTSKFLGQGFDKCEIPTLEQLSTWMTTSPYRVVNLYIGGLRRSCANTALTSSYVTLLSQQGWKFIPTWVGPQCLYDDISDDPAMAYSQGVAEANAAISAVANLGLTLPDSAGTIIYYDMEAYTSQNPSCRNPAKSFVAGWTDRLHATGNLSGVYGSSCAANISDFADISDAPDAVWPAHYLEPYQYRVDASVMSVACLSDSLWGNSQRIRQYAGGHNETWGSVSLTIDSNAIDGIVADLMVPYQSYLPVINKK